MLSIRLFRTGKKNQAFFKIVVTDKRRPPKGGRFVEEVGFLNPLTKEKRLKKERIKYWLSAGAKPSDTVHNLLIKEKILEDKKIPVHKKKKKEEEAKKETSVSAVGAADKKEAAVKEEKPKEEVRAEAVKDEESKTEEAKKETKTEEPKKEEKDQQNT